MRFVGIVLIAASGLASTGDAGFNGRWNIQVDTGRGRVWWLEVHDAGSPHPAGFFVGAPGGQVDPVTEMSIANSELTFVIRKDMPGATSGERRKIVQTYRARLEGGKLTGTMEAETDGAKQAPVPWTGMHAPDIKEHDDGSWKPSAPVELFNSRDTTGWRLLLSGRPGWKVRDGVLVNEQGASDIFSDAKFWNFILRAEYRYQAGSNSGIGLRGRYEIQIYDNYGKPPDWHGNGALYCRIAPKTNASKPAGEWQTLETRLVGRDLTVTLNGVKIIDHQDVVGPTAVVMDPYEDTPGPILLQGDHGPIEFRKVEIIPLTK
jgi:hypothetical protein